MQSKVRTGQFSLGQFVECGGGEIVLHWWGTFKPHSLKGPPMLQHRTFPLGYLAMGKNVFSQINDMFIQKEVTTLFRSSAASKFERKMRVSERGRQRVREKEKEFFLLVFDKSQNLDILTIPSAHVLHD